MSNQMRIKCIRSILITKKLLIKNLIDYTKKIKYRERNNLRFSIIQCS